MSSALHRSYIYDSDKFKLTLTGLHPAIMRRINTIAHKENKNTAWLIIDLLEESSHDYLYAIEQAEKNKTD